jgi:hypothetical protein
MLKRLAAVTGVFALLFIMTSCSMWKNAPSGWAGATGGEQLERLFWDDIKTKNWVDLNKHLAPMFVSSSPDSRRDKESALEHWKQYDLQSVSLADVQVHTAGADFIVTALVTVTGTANGKPLPSEPVHTLSVWQQVSKGFIVVAHTDSLP